MEQSSLESRLTELERRHRVLSSELTELRAAVATAKESDGLAKAESRHESERNAMAEPPPLPPELPKATQPVTPPLAQEAPMDLPSSPVPAWVDAAAAQAESAKTLSEGDAAALDSEAPERESLELRLGRVWLARLGILMVVTGFVFLCNYAYRGFIADWPPIAKVAGLFVVSFALVPLGQWISGSRESLQRFGRVVAGGGCALVYYTTFAAHYVERLKVIASPVVAGVLLTAVAAAIVLYARWQRAPMLALGALVLAFASVAMTPLGWFAVVALSVLAVAALVLAPGIGGVAAGWVSLVGTFGAYAFWQGWVLQITPEENPGRWPLLLWWLLHLAAAMPGSRSRMGDGKARAAFLLTNHFALVFLMAFDWSLLEWSAKLGPLLLVAGAVVLAVGAWAWLKEGRDSELVGPHLAQGLGFLTLGLVVELSGYQLFLALALKGLVLLLFAQRFDQAVARVAGLLATIGGAILGLWHAGVVAAFATTSQPRLSMVALALAMVAGGVIANRDRKLRCDGQKLTPGLVFSSLAAMIAWLGISMGLEGGWVLLAGIGIVFEAGPALSRVWRSALPDSLWPGRAAVSLAGMAIAIQIAFDLKADPLWTFAAGAAVLALGIMLRRDWENAGGNLAAVFCHFHALMLVWIFACFVFDARPGPQAEFLWLPLGCGVLVAGSGLLRLPALRIHAHWLLLPAFASIIDAPEQSFWLIALQPVFVPVALAFRSRREESSLRFFYALAATIYFSLWWIGFVPHAWVGLALLAMIVVLPPLASRLPGAGPALGLAFGAAAVAAALANPPGWTHHLALVVLLVARNFARPRGAMAAITAVALIVSFLYALTEHASAVGVGAWRAVIWSAAGFALLAGGLAANDRALRIGGLATLGVALAHAVLVDVWKFSSLVRIVSFTGLGVALLLAGYGYNRWHERIRKLF